MPSQPANVSESDTSSRTASRLNWRQKVSAGILILLTALPLLDRVNLYTLVPLLGTLAIIAWHVWQSRVALDANAVGHEGSGTQGHAAPRLINLLLGVLPVWRQHVLSAKTQIDDAMSDLIVHFASITDEFEAAGFKGSTHTSEDENKTSALLSLCERDLQQVIDTMNVITNSKGDMSASLSELSSAAKELQAMVQGVAQIAAQTNLLAINAAIEAAHAGDSGRGFATIAKEIRYLSQSSAQTASQITDRIARVTNIMADTSEAATNATQNESEAIAQSSQVVSDVLQHMQELSEGSQTMRERGNVIRQNIEQLIVNLQFHDRVSQVISVVDADMTRLRDSIESDASAPAPEQWLQDLKRHYTMREQRQTHVPTSHLEPATAAAKTASKAVYF
ncbi:MAG: hypothetical protein EPO09_03600 [Aquabacterium sp.]|uniref:methyl-accepting chemotaxis protein n=1 Tax=Aquabacterium sp. TaxID=1872578 RepID=UPI0011F97166|nr:methyl-accepting chemotaxis protein [Aquabacterium sp.]TAK97686.1 MAG: hypothetical protein EPO09_03600 [Aquabacterium sp.]